MSGKRSDAPAEEGSNPPGKSGRKRSHLLPAGVVAVGLLGGAYLMSSGGSAKAASGAAGAAKTGPTATSTTVAEGPIVKLDSITLNLADGRYLKVGIALQLSKKAKPDGFQTTSAKALDLTISTFGAKTYAQLSAPGGRDQAKSELAKRVRTAYGGDVLGIYFTEFVMQ